jgi:hypothetical protein
MHHAEQAGRRRIPYGSGGPADWVRLPDGAPKLQYFQITLENRYTHFMDKFILVGEGQYYRRDTIIAVKIDAQIKISEHNRDVDTGATLDKTLAPEITGYAITFKLLSGDSWIRGPLCESEDDAINWINRL